MDNEGWDCVRTIIGEMKLEGSITLNDGSVVSGRLSFPRKNLYICVETPGKVFNEFTIWDVKRHDWCNITDPRGKLLKLVLPPV